MSSWQMKGVALFVNVVHKRAMSTRERALRTIAAPKGPAGPPKSLRLRMDVSEELFGDFVCYTVQLSGSVPSDIATSRTVVYLHGGAYIGEIAPAHWTFVTALAEAGCRVLVPSYGLAPRHHVDEAIDFVTAVYKRLLETTPASKIAFAGDSAGGGLALAVAQSLVGRVPTPGHLVLISPWVDVTMSNADITPLEKRDPWLSRVGLVEAGKAWVGTGDVTHPHASPLFGSFAGLPPTDVVIGTRDLFHADTLLLVQHYRQAEAPCSLEEVEGGVHVFPLTPTPEGRATARRLVRVLTTF